MKVFHEAPKSIFEDVQLNTDGDYALVHLFETDAEYYNMFREAVDKGREVILDNSIFELEVAFDAEKFAGWVAKLEPTWYIVPDALDDMQKTIAQFLDFISTYPDLPGKRIAVLQGATDEELLICYKWLNKACDMVAVSFNCSHWLTMNTHLPLEERLVVGRQAFIGDLIKYMGDIGIYKPIHLLGCALPQEFEMYKGAYYRKHIYSVDTSNPVVHGMHGVYYESGGLDSKIGVKLHTLINAQVSASEWLAVMYNILEFRRLCNVDSAVFPDRKRASIGNRPD